MTEAPNYSPTKTTDCPYAGPGQKVFYSFTLSVPEHALVDGDGCYSLEIAVERANLYTNETGDKVDVLDRNGDVVYTTY